MSMHLLGVLWLCKLHMGKQQCTYCTLGYSKWSDLLQRGEHGQWSNNQSVYYCSNTQTFLWPTGSVIHVCHWPWPALKFQHSKWTVLTLYREWSLYLCGEKLQADVHPLFPLLPVTQLQTTHSNNVVITGNLKYRNNYNVDSATAHCRPW